MKSAMCSTTAKYSHEERSYNFRKRIRPCRQPIQTNFVVRLISYHTHFKQRISQPHFQLTF